jgi:hypothetical protein
MLVPQMEIWLREYLNTLDSYPDPKHPASIWCYVPCWLTKYIAINYKDNVLVNNKISYQLSTNKDGDMIIKHS